MPMTLDVRDMSLAEHRLIIERPSELEHNSEWQYNFQKSDKVNSEVEQNSKDSPIHATPLTNMQ